MRAENFARDKEANFPTSFWVAGEEASPCGAAGQYAKGRRCCPSPNAACGWPPGARWSVVEPQQLAPARGEPETDAPAVDLQGLPPACRAVEHADANGSGQL